MNSQEPSDRLTRFFAGIAEHTFHSQLGVVDPPLVDYISDLLTRFVRPESAHRLRSVTGQPLADIGEMVNEATQRLGDAKYEIHRYIGDFALFWAGVYPEALRRRSRHGEHDQFSDYCVHGKRAYQIASQIDTSQEDNPSPDLFERLADRFELCAYGLREVRREWERHDEDGGSGLLLN